MKIILLRDVTIFCIVNIDYRLKKPVDFVFWVTEKKNLR